MSPALPRLQCHPAVNAVNERKSNATRLLLCYVTLAFVTLTGGRWPRWTLVPAAAKRLVGGQCEVAGP